MLSILNQLYDGFGQGFPSPLRQTGKALPDDKLKVDRLLTRMLMLGVKMAFPSRTDGLFHAVHQRRIHMLLNPGMHQHRFILERQQVIYRSLRSAGLNVAGNQLTFPVLLYQIFPFPAAFKIFQLLIFHCDLNVTV